MSPLVHLHTYENMWAATCEYVAKLMNPQDMGEKMTLAYGDQDEGSMPCDLYADGVLNGTYTDTSESDFENKLEAAP
eukprot:1771588-Ditylum_brightwellii.AAC.1